jgi:preprotein translocase subunit SecD
MKYTLIIFVLFSLILSGCVTLRERNAERISSDLIVVDQDREKFVPIPIERKDGFYETVDYVPGCEPEDVQLEETPALTFEDLEKVYKGKNSVSKQHEIVLMFTTEASETFHLLSRKNIGKPIAIVLDKHIVSMPIVNGEIYGGRACISGDYSEEEIDRMIKILND